MKRSITRVYAISIIALALASCSSDETPVPPPPALTNGCPKVAIIRDLSVYQHPAAADESNLVISARMGNLKSNCRVDENGNAVEDPMLQSGFDVVALRGSNTAGKRAAMPFSVSVVDENDQVIKKEIYEIPILFHDNSNELHLTVPVNPMVGLPPDQDASKYQVLVGFQLSKDQLNANTNYFSQIAEPTPQQ